jgi:toxin ParE1/3/4
MAYRIIWSNQAENELDKIFEYYSDNAGINIAQKLIEKIISEPNALLTNPEMTQREEHLFDRENVYRYLVCKNYKLIIQSMLKKNL